MMAAHKLLAEDNEINQLIAVELLQGAGASVQVTASGQEAVDALLRASEAPVWVFCDPEVMSRVIANLVGNALKFTPATGRIRLTFDSTEAGVRAMVEDTGPGIPEGSRERIFEKFGQVEGQREGRNNSTGLGLTFCELAVEAHGGRIGVNSQAGKGSTFWFVLPHGKGPAASTVHAVQEQQEHPS